MSPYLEREVIHWIIIFILFILLERILNTNSIVNNGNILTMANADAIMKQGKDNIAD